MYRIWRMYEDRYKAYVTSSKYILIREEQKDEYAGTFKLQEAQDWIKKNNDYDWQIEEILEKK